VGRARTFDVKRHEPGVPRETLQRLAERHSLAPDAAPRFEQLLLGLAAEPDPHTTVSDPASATDVHIADSLAGLEVEQLRRASRIADLGAGAGFPGLVLAAALPGARVDLIESAGRKAQLIARLAESAGIDARPVHARAEDWAGADGGAAYDAVTARALAPLAVIAEYAAPLLAADGVLVAWKGVRDADEEASGVAAAAQLGLELVEVRHVTPFRGSRNRHLHVYLKVRPTPDRFPRRAGMAAKRPLA
jgi:16S rRNA (guanine527-N7)-methyltransferase